MSLAVLVRVLLLLQAPPPAGETVLWFGGSGPGLDEGALLDAVAVYTRDLRLAVDSAAPVSPPAPAVSARAADAVAALRARGARLGFWCEMRADRQAALLTTVDRGGRVEVHTVDRTRGDDPELYRAVALMLRSVLVAVVGTELLSEPSPAPAPAENPIVTPAASSSSPPPAPAPAALAVAAVGARPERSAGDSARRPFVGLGYRLSAPFGTAPLQSALSVEAGLPFRSAFEVSLSAQLGPRVTGRADTGNLSVFDLPIALGARFVSRRSPRWAVGAGPFAALHLLWASATANGSGAEDSAFSTAAAVGAEVLARVRLAGQMAGELRISGEAGLPGTRFWVGQTHTLDVGSRVGLGLGVLFPAP